MYYKISSAWITLHMRMNNQAHDQNFGHVGWNVIHYYQPTYFSYECKCRQSRDVIYARLTNPKTLHHSMIRVYY